MKNTEQWLFEQAKKVDKDIELSHLYTNEFSFGGAWVMDLLEEYHQSKLKNNGGLGGVVGQSEQLLAFGWYIMEHSNVNDGKTAKDYLEDFLSQ